MTRSRLVALLLVVGVGLSAGHRDLDHHVALGTERAVGQHLRDGLDALLDPLGVVEAVDAEHEELRVAESLADLAGPCADRGVRRHLDDLIAVDRDGKGAHADGASLEGEPRVRAARAGQLSRESREVRGAGVQLEADQVGAQEPGEDLAAPRQLHEEFAGWEGDVAEEADHDVGSELAQHLGDELQLVVVDPHGAPGRDALGDRRGEAHVDVAVRVPPLAVEGGRADGVMVERPQGGVGEAEVELLVLLVIDRDGLQPDPLVGRRGLFMVGRPGPPDP